MRRRKKPGRFTAESLRTRRESKESIYFEETLNELCVFLPKKDSEVAPPSHVDAKKIAPNLSTGQPLC